ncbi:MAG TPA: 4Fe-4S dicluster domain-containing protein [Chitinophagaceae bacterium]
MSTFLKTIGNLFKPPVTKRYPFEKTFLAENYRGMIGFNEEACIWCRRCEMACPPGAIVFSQAMDGKQTYHYNRAVCIFCEECIRSCPKAEAGALYQTGVPAPCALKEENINNGWADICSEAVRGREAYSAEKKRLAAQKAVVKEATGNQADESTAGKI